MTIFPKCRGKKNTKPSLQRQHEVFFMIRIIIAGSRDFNDYALLEKALREYITSRKINPDEIEIVSGHARGADSLGELFAKNNKLQLAKFPAQWDKYGKSAGYIRNREMADYALQETGVLFAFWDGQSRGTNHMINFSREKGLEVNVVQF
jgi:hypothetical protein